MTTPPHPLLPPLFNVDAKPEDCACSPQKTAPARHRSNIEEGGCGGPCHDDRRAIIIQHCSALRFYCPPTVPPSASLSQMPEKPRLMPRGWRCQWSWMEEMHGGGSGRSVRVLRQVKSGRQTRQTTILLSIDRRGRPREPKIWARAGLHRSPSVPTSAPPMGGPG